MEFKTQEEKLKLLEETVLYYSENTLRRCIRVENVYAKCFYNGANNELAESKGCAIGRLLSKELAEQFDTILFNDSDSSVKFMFKYLPENVQAYGIDYLIELQRIHDNKANWDGNGLTIQGRENVKAIEKSIINKTI